MVTAGLLTFPDLEQGSPEWLQARCGKITASTVGKLITGKTLKPANNPESRSLCTLLATERITQHVDPTFTSDDMWRGIENEPKARHLYSINYHPADEYGFMVRELDGATIGYSPDGLVSDDGLIEIKSPRPHNHLATLINDDIPAQYMPQVQAGMLVSGRAWCDYISYSPGLPLYVKRIHRDDNWQAALAEAAIAAETSINKIIHTYHERVRDLVATEREPEEIRI